MAIEGPDGDLWEACVVAERKLAGCRAAFYQNAQNRAEALTQALSGSGWDRTAALRLLDSLPDDVPDLLDQLIEYALSQGSALQARRAIGSGRGIEVVDKVRRLVEARLFVADAEEYRRLAELLTYLMDWGALRDLVRRAAASQDPETREVGEDFNRTYGPLLDSALE
jgi:hypothetical protein